MSDRARLIHAILRKDFASFVRKCFATIEPGKPFHDNWHIHHIAWQLSRVRRGECRRLIINIPPRHLKSICVSIAFPAWLLGHDPSLKILAISYAEDFAATLAAQFRAVVESSWYQKTFPRFRLKERRKREIITTENGSRFAGSVGGGILGRGADLIIIDDPIKPQDALSAVERRRVNEFYDNSAYTRLNDKARGAVVIVMQRLHEGDLVGHLLGQENWDLSVIPAIATERQEYRIGPEPRDLHVRQPGEVICPEREDHAVLEQVRRTMGSMNFSAQYQQEPLPASGNAIKAAWVRHYHVLPPELELVVASWDTASTLGENSDFSVGTVWGIHDGNIYLLDVIREQMETPELRRRIQAVHAQHRAHATVIEATDIGRAITQEMRQSSRVRPILVTPRFDKEARLLAQASKFESGQVLLPREASWLGPYLSELLAFPNGSHDDQVDSTSQALTWLSDKLARRAPQVRRNPRRPPGPRPRPPGA